MNLNLTLFKTKSDKNKIDKNAKDNKTNEIKKEDNNYDMIVNKINNKDDKEND